MWDVRDVGCSVCGMSRMWDVRDVGCLRCGMRDAGCLSGCGMLIYKIPISLKRSTNGAMNDAFRRGS